MSKRIENPEKEYGYDAGFIGLEIDSKEQEQGDNLRVLSTKVMTGNELEEFLEQYGQQFPITVGIHNVRVDEETGEIYYTDFYGVKRTVSKEKSIAYRNKQEKQGTLKQQGKNQDKTEGIR